MSGMPSSAACGTANSTASAGSAAPAGPGEPSRHRAAPGAPPGALTRRAAEPADFPEPRAADEGTPLSRRERQDRPVGILAVANSDLASGQARHLDAVAVGEAEGTLDPDRVHLPAPRHLLAARVPRPRPRFPMAVITFDLTEQ